MPAITYPYNLIQGLSDFWTRFFADSPQLEALYEGTAVAVGQAYLDLLSSTLGVSLRDAVALDKEYYRLIAIREDETRFVEGVTPSDNRWSFRLFDPVVSFASLDNRVIEPSASLEPTVDYEIADKTVYFKVDPTDVTGAGIPVNGFARRGIDVITGGEFKDSAVNNWLTLTDVKKGDIIRLLDIGVDGQQRKVSDHVISLVRTSSVYVASETPFLGARTPVTYEILRTPAQYQITGEAFTLDPYPTPPIVYFKKLANTRIDQGSVRVYAKNTTGADVVETVDYVINYESGTLYAFATWYDPAGGTFSIDYTWKKEVHPLTGTPWHNSTTGAILSSSATAQVVQIAAWAPDTVIDRRTLAKNFGVFVSRQKESSEVYRSFLQGLFQLYILGPTLKRMESALNVVLNLPVVKKDGEKYLRVEIGDPAAEFIFTEDPDTGDTVTYAFPKGTPLRSDFIPGQTFEAFEPLTVAVTITDYVQTPSWWYGEIIPKNILSAPDGSTLPVYRRFASSAYVLNSIAPSDGAEIGDPGLLIGADENGFIPPDLPPPAAPGTPHPVFRHRLAFVLMDRYLKFHMFSVKFNPFVLSTSGGPAFTQSLIDLNELVLSAKPAHTYVMTTPETYLRDEINAGDDITVYLHAGWSAFYGPDKVVFADDELHIGVNGWAIGDYFHYELYTETLSFFPSFAATPGNVPAAPRRRRLVHVYIDGTIAGKALIENADYTVNYDTGVITRLTSWDSTTVAVTYRQVNVGNVADAPPGAGDMVITVGNIDPAIVTAQFDPTAKGWDGVTTPPTAPRDIAMVERALIVYPH